MELQLRIERRTWPYKSRVLPLKLLEHNMPDLDYLTRFRWTSVSLTPAKAVPSFSLVVCLQPGFCLSRKITCNLLVSKGNRTLQINDAPLMSPRLRRGGRRRTRTATLHPKWSMLPLHYVLHISIAFYLSYFYGSLPLFMSELFCAPQLLLYSKLLEPGSSGWYFLYIVCSCISFTLAI